MGVCRRYDESSLPEDLVVELLNRLPSRSVARFNCVCKPWHKHISWIRSIRFKPSPTTLGFFYEPHARFNTEQVSYLTTELPSVFDSADLVQSVISSIPDQVRTALVNSVSVFNEPVPLVRVLASSKSILLCTIQHTDDIYVYNPSTNQSTLVPFGFSVIPTEDAVAFTCYHDDALDQLHYMVVRYTRHDHTEATIETFSSQTGKCVDVSIPLLDDVPQFATDRPGVAVLVHEGRYVFYWFEGYRTRIVAVDVAEETYWFIQLPQPLPPLDRKLGDCFLGVSADDGYLYCTTIEGDQLNLWRLKAVPGGQSNEVWVLKYSEGDFVKLAMQKCSIDNNNIPESFRGTEAVFCISVIGIHPASTNIVYVKVFLNLISFDFQTREVQLIDHFPEGEFKTFMHEWYEWPRLLPPLPTSTSIPVN